MIEAQRVKHPTTTRAIDALIGDEGQNGKQKRTERKKETECVPNPANLVHSVSSYDAQGSYGETILFTGSQVGINKKKKYIYIYIYICFL